MAVSITDTYPMGTARGNTCYACGAAQRSLPEGRKELVVDLGQTIDFEGFLFLCESCVVEAARLLGMATATDVDHFGESVAEQRARAEAAEQRAMAAEELLDAMRRYDAQRAEPTEKEVGEAVVALLGAPPVEPTPTPRKRAPKAKPAE